MGLTARALVCAAAAAAVIAATLIPPAAAAPRAKTRFDGIRDCERLAAVQFRQHNPAFRRFTIDRAGVEVDKFAEKVGSVFIATIYHGPAIYEGRRGAHPTRFICLHGGVGKDALFVYTLPD